MRRLQIYLEEHLDTSLTKEAARRGVSKAAIVREVVAKELAPATLPPADPWTALDGWLSDGGVDDLDAAVYDEP